MLSLLFILSLCLPSCSKSADDESPAVLSATSLLQSCRSWQVAHIYVNDGAYRTDIAWGGTFVTLFSDTISFQRMQTVLTMLPDGRLVSQQEAEHLRSYPYILSGDMMRIGDMAFRPILSTEADAAVVTLHAEPWGDIVLRRERYRQQ